jgi:3-hydroxymyristoyl/3-hydroxydecanoyl-(acyl carrier protein) dehydratase
MIIEQALVVPQDHPAIAGHFPGNPIVPGVVMLDSAAALAEAEAGRRVTGVRAAKFRSPLRPGTECLLRLSLRADGALDLLCSAGDRAILTAILDCDEGSPEA